jgi:hypothetical protein
MSLSQSSFRRNWPVWLIAGWLVIPILAGCNGDEDSQEDDGTEQDDGVDDDNAEPLSDSDDGESEGDLVAGNGRPSDEDADTTEWIGDIPYDVYYDRPLEVALNNQSIASNDAVVNNVPDPMEDPVIPDPMDPTTDTPIEDPPPMTQAGGPVDWEQVIPIEVLNEEVKQIRNRLTANLQTVATFNREQEANAMDAVVLSALAAIAIEHPGDLNWKDKAPHIRDLANVIFVNSSSTGREPFALCEVAFEQIQIMLDGGPVPPEVMADPARHPMEVADRYDLMQRFDQTSSHLKSNVNSEARLKEDVPGVVRELSVLAALATLIAKDGYVYAEEPEYQGYLTAFRDSVMASRTGAQQESYEQFSQGLAGIQKACQDCHGQYALGTEIGL